MARPSKPTAALDDQLRDAIADDDRTPYGLARDSGVDERVIRRFLARQRDVTMGSAARIAEALGMQLVKVKGRR
jgi:plasmid maintenance system antidote protein VapI